MQYSVKSGDSPATIARRFGVSRQALINANPHKPRTVVAGQHTWQGLRHGETVNVPTGGTVGDGFLGVTPAAPGGSHPQVKRYAGSPPDQVALVQSRLGLTTDGVFGAGTESAVKAFQASNGLAADGIVGPGTWAKLLGGAAAPTAAVPTFAAPAAAASSVGVAGAAAAAVAALTMDPGYCTSVAKSGTAVNTAVHNFKAAWNAANPGQSVPIGTGKYEPVVAAALSSALGGIPVPPGCGGAAAPAITPIALPSIALPQIPSVTPVSLPTAGSVPTAVQALASIDPCYSGNAAMVCAAQAALGLSPDGKYGPGTAAALRRFVPNAPAGCSGPPLWWGKTTDNKCGGALPSLPSAPIPLPTIPLPSIPTSLPLPLPSIPTTASSTPWSDVPTATAPIPVPSPAAPQQTASAPSAAPSTPGGPAQPVVVAPADKGISTGAMVAGGLGIAALVGVVAVAAGGKKTTTTRTTTTRPARRRPSKPAHHKKK